MVIVLDLLRHSAEQTLVDMLELLFSRLPQLSSDTCNDADVTTDQVLMMPSEGIVSTTTTATISSPYRRSHDQRN